MVAESASSHGPRVQRLPDGTAVDLDRWQRDGVLVFPNFFSSEEMAALRGCVETLLENIPDSRRNAEDTTTSPQLADPWGRGRVGGVAGLYTQKFDTEMVRLDGPISKRYPDVIEKIENSPKLVALTQALIGTRFSNVENMCSVYFRGMGHAWHQDTGTDEDLAAQMMLNRLIYFQDHSPAKGGLYFVPGSIHQGHLTQLPGPHHGHLPGEVEVIPTAGTLVMLHSRCYHRVGHNTTDEPRLMFNLRAKPDTGAPFPTPPHHPTHTHTHALHLSRHDVPPLMMWFPGYTATTRAARADLARFTIWRNQTWDHGRQRPWPNGLALDERAQAGEEPEIVPNATVAAVSSDE
jgi:hypothetical protein